VIVVRKRSRSADDHGHHGGSWKVAYADFVTAMMAFFLVMWIMGLDDGVKTMVQGYFEDPMGFEDHFAGGINPLPGGTSAIDLNLRQAMWLSRQAERARLSRAASSIEGQLRGSGLMNGLEASVEVGVVEEGLRLELMETGDGTFFDRSSARLRPSLQRVLEVVAPELEALPNAVVVEGHTDAMPFVSRPGYTNWELSVDRANAARAVLGRSGLSADRVVEVRGHADRRLKIAEDPRDPRNRRISILLPFRGDDAELPPPQRPNATTAQGASP
jgi:chemotaxis protein MotB